MNYTKSDAFITAVGTGNPMHQGDLPVPTAVSAVDMNMVIWSLMAVVEAAGLTGADFDPDDASTYQRVRDAIVELAGPSNATITALSNSLANPAGTGNGAGRIFWGRTVNYIPGSIGYDMRRNAALVRIAPAGYGWAGIMPKVCLAPGAAQFSERVGRYARRTHAANIGGGEVWVDPVNGSDANSGSEASPVQTLAHAVQDLSPSVINCLPGQYAPFAFNTGHTQAGKLKILRAIGECVIREAADDPATATFTQDGVRPNCYWMPLTPANKPVLALLDTSQPDETGQPRSLARYASLALLDGLANGSGYFHDAGANRLYVRYGRAGVDFNTLKARTRLVTGDASSRVLVSGTRLLMEGRWRLEGVHLAPFQSAGARAYLYLDVDSTQAPTCAYSVTHGLDANGADAYVHGAWMHRNKGDNLHYSDNGGLPSRAVEIGCKSMFAGDVAGEPSAPSTSNGSAMHDTGSVIRINGYYGRNFGPDIVDSGTGATWMVGTVAESGVDSGNSYAIYANGVSMTLDCCVARNGLNTDIRAEASAVKIFATSYVTSVVASGGSIGELLL